MDPIRRGRSRLDPCKALPVLIQAVMACTGACSHASIAYFSLRSVFRLGSVSEDEAD